jgi:hypothetical protein
MIEPIHPFDLQARAELAIHGLTGLLDPERAGLMYFLGDWRAKPPRADHNLWDCGDGCGRFVDALTLVRGLAGRGDAWGASALPDEQLEGWMLRFLDEDGLSWLPTEEWAAPWGSELLMASTVPGEAHCEISWAQRGTLMGLLSRFLRTGSEGYLTKAKTLVDGLLKLAVRHPGGLYFPEGYYTRRGWNTTQPGLFAGIEETNAAVIVPALRLHALTGYAPALELADGLARFALKNTRGYTADGSMQAPDGGAVQEHFHTRSNFIMGILRLGLALGQREYVAWARQSYAAARRWGADFGWFPEHLGQRHGEVCCTTDMIEIALLLAKHVDPAYYADAERYGRNHLFESQILSFERLENALAQMPAKSSKAPYGGKFSTTQDVARRQVGAFASRPALNDAFHMDVTDLMQCCNAAGARALYDLWNSAVEEIPSAADGLPLRKVNLRFSVETPALRVVSHEPAAGRLEITARDACRVAVRLPGGTGEALVVRACARGDPRVEVLPAQAGYVTYEAAPGERVDLAYPLSEHSAAYRVGSPGRELHATAYWRGETVMRVEPAGIFYPLYDRPAGLAPVAPRLPAQPLIPSI